MKILPFEQKPMRIEFSEEAFTGIAAAIEREPYLNMFNRDVPTEFGTAHLSVIEYHGFLAATSILLNGVTRYYSHLTQDDVADINQYFENRVVH